MIDFISEVPGLEEACQDAWIKGDMRLYNILKGALGLEEELTERLEVLEDRKEYTEELQEKMEHLEEFFNECFERLQEHYPCPSWSSEHDKNIIYNIIMGV